MNKYILYGMAGLGLVIVLLNVIAPLTKSDKDNKLLDFLRKLEEVLLKTVIPQVRELMKEEPTKTE